MTDRWARTGEPVKLATPTARRVVVEACFSRYDAKKGYDIVEWRRRVCVDDTEARTVIAELTDRYGAYRDFEVFVDVHDGNGRRSLDADLPTPKPAGVAAIAAIRDRLRNGRDALAAVERAAIESDVF